MNTYETLMLRVQKEDDAHILAHDLRLAREQEEITHQQLLDLISLFKLAHKKVTRTRQ